MKLNPAKTKRLSFIKYLYNTGVEQSYRSEPINYSSILVFHDAIELFLVLGCEHLNVGKKNMGFLEYFNSIEQKLETSLSQRQSLIRLNKARVNLKHYGVLPNKSELEGFRAITNAFFEDNTPIIFDTSFSTISLADFIENEIAKDLLKKVERNIADENLNTAIDNCALSFQVLIDEYLESKETWYGDSPFSFQDRSGFKIRQGDIRRNFSGTSINDYSRSDRILADYLERINTHVNNLEEAFRIVALGIDYRRFSKFKLLTPKIFKVSKKEIGDKLDELEVARNENSPQLSANKNDVEFCFNFTIETALAFQDFDFAIEDSKKVNN